MEAHSTIPERKYFFGVAHEVCWIVEEYITEPPTTNNSEKYEEKECVHVFFLYFTVFSYKKVTKRKSNRIHESVPCRGNVDAEK